MECARDGDTGLRRALDGAFGRFFTPADIENSPAIRTTDLLFGIPGVSVVGDRAQIRAGARSCSPEIRVDGLRQSVDVSLDLFMPLEALAAVEVYRRATEVPLQYGGTRVGCGVILFWTKTGI